MSRPFTLKRNYLNPARHSQDIVSLNIDENINFGPVDAFDIDLPGHKTIGFFLVPWVTFGCSIIRIREKLWPVESSQMHKQKDRHCETYISRLCFAQVEIIVIFSQVIIFFLKMEFG